MEGRNTDMNDIDYDFDGGEMMDTPLGLNDDNPDPMEDETSDLFDDSDPDCEPDYDDGMDGDAESALASVGWGTDEDYGDFGGNDDF